LMRFCACFLRRWANFVAGLRGGFPLERVMPAAFASFLALPRLAS
jgi:hypothetical protein